jgi:rhamnogalacturonyl hydrolase YesR
MRWKKRIAYTELKKLWTESVDRKMRKQLAKWTDNQFTNDQRVVQVDAITSRGIADYCTKVTNYVTKGPKSVHTVSEIGKLLYRRRTTGWLGDLHGNKKEGIDIGSEISPI